MASKNIVLKGATWNGVESVDFPVSGGGTARYVETSGADATAADIASGKTAYVNGSLIVGTASGGGGLEYESGTWEPTGNTTSHIISFAGTHATAPFYYMIQDSGNDYYSQQATAWYVTYTNMHQFSGAAIDVDNGTTYQYGFAYMRYRTSATVTAGTTKVITTPYTSQSDSAATNSRFWAKETGIRAYCDDFYFRAGRTYKWIAVWAPTS